jgi:large subunit ribosomal protein L21
MNSSSIYRWSIIAKRVTPSISHHSPPLRLSHHSRIGTSTCTSVRGFTTAADPAADSLLERDSESTNPSTPSARSIPNEESQFVFQSKPYLNPVANGPIRAQKPFIEPHLDSSVATLLPLLRSQGNHYAQIYIQGRPYLVTPGDSVRLPFILQGVNLGDVIRLNRATVFGSRDYTLKAGVTGKGEDQRYIDERLFVARATVMNVVYEPRRIKVKKQPRVRHARHFPSKHSYTVLRISELRTATEEELASIETEGARS